MFLKFLYVGYWVIMGVVIYRYEKKIAALEEENRHVKALLDIVGNGRKSQKESGKMLRF